MHPYKIGSRTVTENLLSPQFSNEAANFRQCLSPIVRELSTWDKNQDLGKALD